jgi:regulator of sigma E protease
LEILDRLVNYGTVALGLGFVIFIHELGHFLVAKWAGVKVEAFALGFGPPLLAFRKGLGLRFGSTHKETAAKLAAAGVAPDDPAAAGLGETEYSFRAIPLGGFVKMLGEGDEANPDAVKTTDPRAYPNKRVGARMAIISAGVIMNLVTGLLFFVWAYGRGGLPVVPARVGAVVAGQPAYEAGLRPGDRVVAVNGREDLDFSSLKRMTAMSGPGESLRMTVARPGAERPITVDVEPRRHGEAEMKTMGIVPVDDLELRGPMPLLPPAGLDPARAAALKDALKEGDRVVAAGPEGETPAKLENAVQLHELLSRNRDRAVALVVRRPAAGGAKGTASASDSAAATELTVTLPPVPVADLGFSLTPGPIVAIQPDSPAAKAGLRVGDRIVAFAGEASYDPMRLPDLADRRAGQPTELTVSRSEAGKPEETRTVTLTPRREALQHLPYPAADDEPLDVPALGVALTVLPTIAAVRPGSPAAKADLKPGETITAVTITPTKAMLDAGMMDKPATLALGGPDPTAYWPSAFRLMQFLPRNQVELEVKGRGALVKLTPEPAEGWFYPLRGLQFLPAQNELPPLGFAAALRRGLDDTGDTIRSVYAMFRSLALGLISPKALGGPLMIADVASRSARAGLEAFLQFLGVLSLNLAVINFLPIPPLDGGQMAFLIAEKLRGRPLPERALNAGTILGLLFVLGLMGFVLFQDVVRYLPG